MYPVCPENNGSVLVFDQNLLLYCLIFQKGTGFNVLNVFFSFWTNVWKHTNNILSFFHCEKG